MATDQRMDQRTAQRMALSPFVARHIGPTAAEQASMLADLGLASLDELIAAVVPDAIRLDAAGAAEGLPAGCSEAEALAELADIAAANQVRRSLIGLGYHDCITPALLQRHVFENPAWYTAYTPYQAEISQGRLEALLNFQTLISELTGLPIANASLLDEATAAAEAMSLSYGCCRDSSAQRFLVDADVLPQTWAVLQTRAEPLGIELVRVEPAALQAAEASGGDPFAGAFGLLLQFPGASGGLWDPAELIAAARAAGLGMRRALGARRPPGELRAHQRGGRCATRDRDCRRWPAGLGPVPARAGAARQHRSGIARTRMDARVADRPR